MFHTECAGEIEGAVRGIWTDSWIGKKSRDMGLIWANGMIMDRYHVRPARVCF